MMNFASNLISALVKHKVPVEKSDILMKKLADSIILERELFVINHLYTHTVNPTDEYLDELDRRREGIIKKYT
jgi:hypothetical protein